MGNKKDCDSHRKLFTAAGLVLAGGATYLFQLTVIRAFIVVELGFAESSLIYAPILPLASYVMISWNWPGDDYSDLSGLPLRKCFLLGLMKGALVSLATMLLGLGVVVAIGVCRAFLTSS